MDLLVNFPIVSRSSFISLDAPSKSRVASGSSMSAISWAKLSENLVSRNFRTGFHVVEQIEARNGISGWRAPTAAKVVGKMSILLTSSSRNSGFKTAGQEYIVGGECRLHRAFVGAGVVAISLWMLDPTIVADIDNEGVVANPFRL